MPVAGTYLRIKIASGADTSETVDLRGMKVLSAQVPTIDSGTFYVECSNDGTTWAVMKDTAGNTVCSWASSTGGFVCDGDALARLIGVNFIRFRTGASQTAERIIRTVVARE